MVTHTRAMLEGYYASDEDVGEGLEYHGFLDKYGNWYIEEYNLNAGTFRYIKGATDYTTNWTGRTGLSYDYFNTVFG